MSYSQPEGRATFFSHDRDSLIEFNSKLRERLDDTGGEYEGPFPLPQMDSDQVDRLILQVKNSDGTVAESEDEFPSYVFEILESEENRELLLEASKLDKGFFARGYKFIGDRIVKTARSSVA